MPFNNKLLPAIGMCLIFVILYALSYVILRFSKTLIRMESSSSMSGTIIWENHKIIVRESGIDSLLIFYCPLIFLESNAWQYIKPMPSPSAFDKSI
jgi:hypothetical protein